MRDLLIETQTGEPAPRQVHAQLLHQLPLAGDAVQIADQQDAQQQLGINRRSASIAVTRFQLLPHKGKADVPLDQPQQMSLWNLIFQTEDQVPETHLLRLIERHISFAFVREKLKASYSDTGRPSIDPELLLRILLIGYLYGITSERKLVEELRMHLAWRWFTGLGFDEEVPHHSTFSKNRHGRFLESDLFQELFESSWLKLPRSIARCASI